MDFTLSDDQQAIFDLAGQILEAQLPSETLRDIEARDDKFAADAWAALVNAQLIGAPLPEQAGGSGLGILEACLVLEQIGRTVAPVPYWATVVLAAMPLAQFGTAAQQQRYLPPTLDGSLILTAALVEDGHGMPDLLPQTTATRDGAHWRLDGTKRFVPAGHLAGHILVPARTGDSTTGVFIIDAGAAGVRMAADESTTFEPQHILTLDGVQVSADNVLGDPTDGADIVEWIQQRAVAGLCAMQAGVCEKALRLTAAHVSEREQFGVKIATFQAVAQRAAEAFIDTEAITLTARQAAWCLAADAPAAAALATAKFWAAEAGQRVVHAAQHLHGGIGVDTDYPVHRYFRWAKQLELTLGGATTHLRRLGAQLATEPVRAGA